MKFLILLCIVFLVSSADTKNLKEETLTNEIPGKNITLIQIEQMFTNISKKPGWDMSKPMLWGYFFTHNEPKLLEKAKHVLVKKGYRFVDLFKGEKEEISKADVWWLHIEKEEIHTAKTLDKKNDEFYILAHKLGLNSYDGMDVGPIKK